MAKDIADSLAPLVQVSVSGVRGSDPRNPPFPLSGNNPEKGDRGWNDLPPSLPLTGPLPFRDLRGGK